MQTHTCHLPHCRKTVTHAEAHYRSISLERVAFCSLGCVALWDELDKAARAGAPELERAAADRVLAEVRRVLAERA